MKEIYADCASTTPISEPALRSDDRVYENLLWKSFQFASLRERLPASWRRRGMELPPASEPTGKKSILHREEPEADNQAIFTAAAYGKAMGKHHMIFFEHRASCGFKLYSGA